MTFKTACGNFFQTYSVQDLVKETVQHMHDQAVCAIRERSEAELCTLTAEEDYREMLKMGTRWRVRKRGSGEEEAQRLRRSLTEKTQLASLLACLPAKAGAV